MIAMALACQPELLIADEPTTALDVTVQAQIMELLARLRRERGTAVLLITHNLALVREQADSVAVMYAGSIVEHAPSAELFAHPTHPYTRLLLRAIPSTAKRDTSLAVIDGQVPAPSVRLPGCRFAPRCPLAKQECLGGPPALSKFAPGHYVACRRISSTLPNSIGTPHAPTAEVTESPLLVVRGLKVHFPVKKGWFAQHEYVHAVDGVDLELRRGETLALVGESGCGKTTVGKALIRLFSPTAGQILLGDTDLAQLPPRRLKPLRRRIQMIFQDPFSSLDPRLMVGESIAEGMDAFALHRQDRQKALCALLQQVGLPNDSLTRYPHQFSGGQRQRIGLARALAVSPEILVCDECTSALDESVQAQILNLLRRLQRELGLAYLFITHDLAVVSYLANRIAVMYLGRIVEQGPCQEVISAPLHPYTRALISAAPRIDGQSDGKLRLAGEIPSPIHPPSGCPFHPRCPLATARCANELPPMSHGEHQVACHFPLAKS